MGVLKLEKHAVCVRVCVHYVGVDVCTKDKLQV